MNQEHFDKMIKENTLSSTPASQEELKQIIAFSKKKTFTQRLYAGAATCCIAFLLASIYAINPTLPTTTLSESDMIFIDDMLALETEESNANDNDIYLYSELITL